MMRRAWALAATGVLAGWAGAQTPKTLPATNVPTPVAGKDAAPESGVMILRTAGAADRKVTVVKSTKGADGRVLTEVKDVATGETLLVADKSAGGKTDAVAPKAAAAKPTTLASDLKGPPTTLVPKAKPRDADPLLNVASAKTPAAMAATAKAKPADAVAAEPNKLKTTFPKPVPTSTAMPSAVASKAAPPAMLPAGMVARAGETVHVVLPVGYVPAEFRMKEESGPYVAALQQAARPTIRQDAATALAEGRFGNRNEVKAVLAGAATHDPAPVVRAHCISCLSKLGYAETNYVMFLRQGTLDADAGVKSAAAEALAKLEPRK